MINANLINQDRENSLQKVLDLRFIQFLLAGLCAFLMGGLSRAEMAEYRDRAYRVRGAVRIADKQYETRQNNQRVLSIWSRDKRPYWREHMRVLWAWVPIRINRFLRQAWVQVSAVFTSAYHDGFSDGPVQAPP